MKRITSSSEANGDTGRYTISLYEDDSSFIGEFCIDAALENSMSFEDAEDHAYRSLVRQDAQNVIAVVSEESATGFKQSHISVGSRDVDSVPADGDKERS